MQAPAWQWWQRRPAWLTWAWLTWGNVAATAGAEAAPAGDDGGCTQGFLRDLGNALRELDDPEAVMATASAKLGAHLGAAQVAYAAIDDAGVHATIAHEWNDGSLPGNSGRYRLSPLGAAVIADLKRGATIAVADVARDRRIASAEALATLRGAAIAAFLNVPLVKAGRLVAVLAVHQRTPRVWSEADVAAARETAERTWAAVGRARAERDRRASEERLRVAGEAAGFGVYDVDGARQRAVWSPGLCRILGREGEEGTVPLDATLATVLPEDHERVGAEMAASLCRPGRYEREFRIARPDGAVRWVLDRGETFGPVDTATGRVRRGTGTLIDITERKLTEEALRDSEARFRTMAEHAPVMVWITDPDGRCTYLSTSWYAFTGQTPETGLGFGWLSAIHHDDRPRAEREYRAASAGRRTFRLDYRLRRRDGAWRWAIDAAAPRFGAGGAFLGYIGSVLDISDRKDAEDALRESEARFRHTFEGVGVALWDVDASAAHARLAELRAAGVADLAAHLAGRPGLAGRLIAGVRVRNVNGATLRLFAATGKAQLVGSLRRIHTRDSLPVFVDMLVALWNGQRQVTSEIRLRKLDGAAFDAHFILVFDGAAAERTLVSVLDITARKRAEAALRRSHDTYLNLIQANPFGIYLVDSRFHLAEVSAGAQKVFSNVRPLIGRDFAEVLRCIWAEPFASEAIGRFRHTLVTGEPYNAPDTTEQRNDVAGVESYDWRIERVALPDGAFGVVCFFYDMTERKLYEQRIRALMGEVNHRAKNMLALVQAVANQTAASEPRDFIRSFQERIQGLATSQDLLVESEWRGVALDDLVRSQLAPFEALVGRRIAVGGPPVTIAAAAAQTLGMALHELVTNASKYGALSNDQGCIDIAWVLREGPAGAWRFALAWSERGGPAVMPPTRRGFGSTVLGAMAKGQLQADIEVDYAPAGLSWRLACAAASVVEGTPGGDADTPLDSAAD